MKSHSLLIIDTWTFRPIHATYPAFNSPFSHRSPPLPSGHRHVASSFEFLTTQPPPGPQSRGQGRSVEIGNVARGTPDTSVNFCSKLGPWVVLDGRFVVKLPLLDSVDILEETSSKASKTTSF